MKTKFIDGGFFGGSVEPKRLRKNITIFSLDGDNELVLDHEEITVKDESGFVTVQTVRPQILSCGHSVVSLDEIKGQCTICRQLVCANCLVICSDCFRAICRVDSTVVEPCHNIMCKDCSKKRWWRGLFAGAARLLFSPFIEKSD